MLAHALDNSTVIRALKLLCVAWEHSVLGKGWVSFERLLKTAAAHSCIAGILRLDLREEHAWRSSLLGRISAWVSDQLRARSALISLLMRSAVRGSITVRLLERAVRACLELSSGSRALAFASGVTGVAGVGAPSAGGAMLSVLVVLLPFLPTTLDVLLIILLLTAWVAQKVYEGDLRVRFLRAYVPGLLLLGSALAATVGSSTIRGSLPAIVLWISYGAIFFVSSQWVEKPADLLWISMSWIASSIGISLIGIHQYLSGVETAASWVDARVAESIKTRVFSVFDNPNMLAEYLTYAVALSSALFLAARSYTERVLYLVAGTVTGLCLVLTFSRGGWVATAFAIAVIGLLKERKLLLALLVALLLSPTFLPKTLLDRAATLVTFDDSSARYRLTIWKAVLRMIQDRWATGVGLGPAAFTKVYPQYEIAGTPAAHSHNLYLQVLVEMGVVGLLLFLWTVFNHLRDAASADPSSLSGRAGFIVVALVSGTIGQLVHGFIDNVWYSPKNVMFFWIAAGLAAGSGMLMKKESPDA